jgi:hypothetical protein
MTLVVFFINLQLILTPLVIVVAPGMPNLHDDSINDETINVENITVNWNVSLPLEKGHNQPDKDLLNALFLLNTSEREDLLLGSRVVKNSLENEKIDFLENKTYFQDISQVVGEFQQLKDELLEVNLTMATAAIEAVSTWEDSDFVGGNELFNRSTFSDIFSSFYEYYLAYYIDYQENPGLQFFPWLNETLAEGDVNERLSGYFLDLTGLRVNPLMTFLQANFTEFPSALISRLDPLIVDLTGKQNLKIVLANYKNYSRETSFEDYQTWYFLDPDESFTDKLANGSLPTNNLGDIFSGDELISVIHVVLVTENITGMMSRNITWSYDNGSSIENPASELVEFVEWTEAGNSTLSSVDTGLADVSSLDLSMLHQHFGSPVNTSTNLLAGEGVQTYPWITIEQYNIHYLDGIIGTDGFEIKNSSYLSFRHDMAGMLTFFDNKTANKIVNLEIGGIGSDWSYISSSTELASRVDMVGFQDPPLFSGIVKKDNYLYSLITLENIKARVSSYRSGKELADFGAVPTTEITIPKLSFRFLLASYPSGNQITLKMDMSSSNWLSTQPGIIDEGESLSLIFTTRSYQKGSEKLTARTDTNTYLDPNTNLADEVTDLLIYHATDLAKELVKVKYTEFPYFINNTKITFATSQFLPRVGYQALQAGTLVEKITRTSDESNTDRYFFLLNYHDWGGINFEHGPEFYLSPSRRVNRPPPITTEETTEVPGNNFWLWDFLAVSPGFIFLFIIVPVFMYYGVPRISKRYMKYKKSKRE